MTRFSEQELMELLHNGIQRDIRFLNQFGRSGREVEGEEAAIAAADAGGCLPNIGGGRHAPVGIFFKL